MKMLVIRGLMSALILHVCFSSVPAEGAEKFWPPWVTEKKRKKRSSIVVANQVVRTLDPFVFEVFKSKLFQSRDETEKFRDDLKKVLDVEKLKSSRFVVTYADELDISPLIPPGRRDFWAEGPANYSLYIALKKHYRNGDTVDDGSFFSYRSISYMSEKEALRATARKGPIAKQSWHELPNGTRVLEVIHRKKVDLLAEASEHLEIIRLCYKYAIPESIGSYRPFGPTYPGRVVTGGGLILPGKMMNFRYVRDEGGGCGARVIRPPRNHALDHHYLSYFTMKYGLNIRRRNGQVVVVGDRGRPVAWKAGPRLYYIVQGGRDMGVVVDAYLEKFRSILPEDYSVDEDRWVREEVRLSMERLRGHMQEQTKRAIKDYMMEYQYLCRWVEPIQGAPQFNMNYVMLDEDLRDYHFARIEQWWENNKDDLPLRKGAPVSRRKSSSGLRPFEQKEALEQYRKKVEAATTE